MSSNINTFIPSILVSVLMCFLTQTVCAQEPALIQTQEKHTLIIEEALDQAEKGFDLDPAPVEYGAVLIEAKVLEIVLNDEHPDGVDWEAIVSDYKTLGDLSFGTVSKEDYETLLEALETVGVIRTIFEKDVDIDHEVSKMINQFDVTPNIPLGGIIHVAIKPEEGTEKEIVIQVQDGSTIVIGSLFNEIMVESTWKIPLLGDLPLLGMVFRSHGQEKRKTETITFLSVKMVEK